MSAFESVFKTQKPLISHYFKSPDTRPPFIISMSFTVALVLVFLAFPVTLIYNGMNLSRCPLSLTVPVFHLCHAGISVN
ncbi:hypothetical protein GJ496_003557 [Pomphorhynchus laevis]|nr:hypothetical protein GJ496_003557 [Pomphorhynchus laevis]